MPFSSAYAAPVGAGSLSLGLVAVLAAVYSSTSLGVQAQRIPPHPHLHVIAHNGVLPIPRPVGVIVPIPVPIQRRRLHVPPHPHLPPHPHSLHTALNLVSAYEGISRRRRGKRPPPGVGLIGPPHRGPPRPSQSQSQSPAHWKGPPKRKGNGLPRDKPWMQATRGSSPAATRVRYRTKVPRKSSKSKKSSSSSKTRPPVPTYADGYAEDSDLVPYQDEEELEERPKKRPSKSRKGSKTSASSSSTSTTYPKGWGPDGGYRIPAPKYPPYGTDENEPGTGHLDLEERFINQHNQFYRDGYPADPHPDAGQDHDSSSYSLHSPSSSSSTTKHKGYYEDEEIEVVDSAEVTPDIITGSSKTRQRYRKPSSKTKYTLDDEGSREEEVYRRPSKSKSKSKSKKKGSVSATATAAGSDDSRRDRDSMYHAKFRGADDRPLSALSFNYELSGSASEQSSATSVNNHRPTYGVGSGSDTSSSSEGKFPSSTDFFRTRKPQYWG